MSGRIFSVLQIYWTDLKAVNEFCQWPVDLSHDVMIFGQ